MVIHGHIRGGVIIADEPAMLPDGAAVRIEVLADMATPPSTSTVKTRQGGCWRGQVVIADDFDELPADMANAFGMKPP